MRVEPDRIKPLILLGAGGHAKVLLSLMQAAGLTVLGVSAPELVESGDTLWRGIPVLYVGDDLFEYCPEEIGLVNGVGAQQGRRHLFDRFKARGYEFPVLIHPHACVDPLAILGEGVQVMAGAVIQVDARLGQNVIVNTQASVDHDCIIEDHVHIAPGASVCGHVHVKTGAFIASNATVIIGIQVGEDAIAGAGASIVRDMEPGAVVLPAPVRKEKNRSHA